MKRITTIFLLILSILFLLIIGFVLLNNSNKLFGISENPYELSYYFDSSKFSYRLENDILSIVNGQDTVELNLSGFNDSQKEEMFKTWNKVNSQGVTTLLPLSTCKYLVIKLFINPQFTYKSLGQPGNFFTQDIGGNKQNQYLLREVSCSPNNTLISNKIIYIK